MHQSFLFVNIYYSGFSLLYLKVMEKFIINKIRFLPFSKILESDPLKYPVNFRISASASPAQVFSK